MDGIALPPVVVQDAPALAGIHHAARVGAMPGLVEPWTEAEVAGWIAGTLPPRRRGVVARGAMGPPSGCLGLAAVGEVLHPYVAPGRQRHGIGTRLIGWAKAAAPSTPSEATLPPLPFMDGMALPSSPAAMERPMTKASRTSAWSGPPLRRI
jgi:GNAT superfamily N-acetyltransferase